MQIFFHLILFCKVDLLENFFDLLVHIVWTNLRKIFLNVEMASLNFSYRGNSLNLDIYCMNEINERQVGRLKMMKILLYKLPDIFFSLWCLFFQFSHVKDQKYLFVCVIKYSPLSISRCVPMQSMIWTIARDVSKQKATKNSQFLNGYCRKSYRS